MPPEKCLFHGSERLVGFPNSHAVTLVENPAPATMGNTHDPPEKYLFLADREKSQRKIKKSVRPPLAHARKG